MSEKPVASIKTLARYEPGTVYIGNGEYVAECVRADGGDYYMAADVDAAIEALHAEIELLRAEVDRLAEALRELEEREQRDEALLRQALEALLGQRGEPDWHTGKQRENAIAALRERLG